MTDFPIVDEVMAAKEWLEKMIKKGVMVDPRWFDPPDPHRPELKVVKNDEEEANK